MEKKYCTFYCKNVNLFSRKYIPRIGANVKRLGGAVGQKGATFIDRLFYMSLCNVVFDILYQTIHGCK
jgi:hypothetical protein